MAAFAAGWPRRNAGSLKMEKAGSVGAKAISFNDTADTAFYRGDKFVVFFCKISILSWIILDQILRTTVMVLV